MKAILPLLLVASLLAACIPVSSAPGPGTAVPISSATLTALPATPTQSFTLEPTPGYRPSLIPSALPLPPGRLGPDEAGEFLRTWYGQNIGPFEIESVEESTPQEVWEQLHAQVFRVRDDVSSAWQSYLVFEGRVWPLDTGFYGQGVPAEDLLVADLEGDSQPELVIAFSYDSGIGQAMRVRVFRLEAGRPELLELDWASEGRLELALDEAGQVLVRPPAQAGAQPGPFGYLVLQGRTLVLAEDPALVADLAVYESNQLGVSFQYPAAWQQVSESRFEGENGFFELSRYESVASGITSAYDGLGLDLARACNWELNEDPARYGPRPQVQFADRGPSGSTCLVIPDEGAQQVDPFLLFHALAGGFGILKADPAHIQEMVQSLRFEFPGGQPPDWRRRTTGDPEGGPVELERTVRSFGDLTLEEHSLYSETEYTPNIVHLSEAMPEMFAARDELRRSNPYYLDLPGQLDYYNALLEPSGYRLAFHGEGEPTALDLFRGDELVRGNLMIVALQLAVSPGGDFALLVEDLANPGWLLVRPGRSEPWDVEAHAYTAPAFAGERLVTVEKERDDRAYRLIVKVEGQPVYTFISSFREPLSVWLSGWGESWVLEVDGTLVADGRLLNLEQGYGEIFDWHLLDGKPFYFFEQGGQVGLSYDGETLPVRYAEVLHGQCCGGGVNPGGSEQMVWFFARRDGMWYYVELGLFE